MNLVFSERVCFGCIWFAFGVVFSGRKEWEYFLSIVFVEHCLLFLDIPFIYRAFLFITFITEISRTGFLHSFARFCSIAFSFIAFTTQIHHLQTNFHRDMHCFFYHTLQNPSNCKHALPPTTSAAIVLTDGHARQGLTDTICTLTMNMDISPGSTFAELGALYRPLPLSSRRTQAHQLRLRDRSPLLAGYGATLILGGPDKLRASETG